MKHFQFELKNRFSCLALEVEQHGNMSEDEDEVAHDNEVEKKKTKIRQTYWNISRFARLLNNENQKLDPPREGDKIR